MLDQARRSGLPAEAWESRQLRDGSEYRIYKRYFRSAELAEEVGGEVVLETETFVVTQATRPTGSARGST